MADISKIILPSGSEYDVKDTTARSNATSAIATAGSANSRANSAYNLAYSAQTRANNAYSLAESAVPATSIITDAQIEQIWEDN